MPVVAEDVGRDNPAEDRDRGDAEIDLGAKQHKRDSDRRHRYRSDLCHHVLHVANGHEDVGREGEEDHFDDQGD
jgi:hypothetical protein